jgi:hypothetical protein
LLTTFSSTLPSAISNVNNLPSLHSTSSSIALSGPLLHHILRMLKPRITARSLTGYARHATHVVFGK